MKPEFISNYQGMSEYKLMGELYEVRHFAIDYGDYYGDVFEREILPKVGTVSKKCSSDFPSDEIMAFFEGYVPARYNQETRHIETIGTPKIVPMPWLDKRNGKMAEADLRLFSQSA